WLLGALVDVLQADPLGLNGVILAAITYVGWRFYERLRMYSIVQQCGVVFVLVLGAELTRAVVLGLTEDRGLSWGVFGPPAVSLLLWPFVALALGRLRLQFRVVGRCGSCWRPPGRAGPCCSGRTGCRSRSGGSIWTNSCAPANPPPTTWCASRWRRPKLLERRSNP